MTKCTYCIEVDKDDPKKCLIYPSINSNQSGFADIASAKEYAEKVYKCTILLWAIKNN